MEQKTYTCIVCPRSCVGTLTVHDDGRLETEGFFCKNGEKYAIDEYKDPKRMMTTTVTLKNGIYHLLPVVSTEEISRKLFPDCLEKLYHTVVTAPVKAGDVIISDIMGTGVDIIAAKSMKERG